MIYNEKEFMMAVRNRRLTLNYTQEYVAFKLNMSQNAYSRFELGNTAITLSRLYDLSVALEMDVKDMLSPTFLN